MDLAKALEIVIARTGHERYRFLTSPDHPDHKAWREHVIAVAHGYTPTPITMPLSLHLALFGWYVESVNLFIRERNFRYAPPPALSPHQERLQLVYGCDYRGAKIGCGCNGTWHCGLGRGEFPTRPHEVSLGECLRCVSGGLPAQETETAPVEAGSRRE